MGSGFDFDEDAAAAARAEFEKKLAIALQDVGCRNTGERIIGFPLSA